MKFYIWNFIKMNLYLVMSLIIKNAVYSEEEIGRFIKNSKIKYVWEFLIENEFHRVEMIDSKLSSKKMIILDGIVIGKHDYVKTYTKYFSIGNHECVILPHWKKYELRIDGIAFNQFIDLNINNKDIPNNHKLPYSFHNKYSYSSDNCNPQSFKNKQIQYNDINLTYNNTSYECLIDDTD